MMTSTAAQLKRTITNFQVGRSVLTYATIMKQRARLGRAAVPFPHEKRARLAWLAERYRLTRFVETGTYYGDTLAYMAQRVDECYSIEINRDLFDRARARFAGQGNVTLFLGNSRDVLPTLVPRLTGPALFWLDAHFQGHINAQDDHRVPIVEEVSAILDEQRFSHALLIDDIRMFSSDALYPEVQLLVDLIEERRGRGSARIARDLLEVRPG